jgi:hypothetical protein
MSVSAMLAATATTLTLQGKVLTVSHPQHTTHTSSEAIVLAIVGALVVLACVAWAFARTLTFEPRWMLSLRHAGAEAGFRAAATWAEFSDWVRLGR